MSDLVERLRGEWELLSGFSIDRGSVDAGISANLASDAADRIEALERERDARQEDSDSYKASMKTYFEQSLSEHNAKVEAQRALAASQAEASRMREALRPFAEYMGDMDRDNLGNPLPDDAGVGWVYLTQGDFRRAKDALSSGSKT